MNKRIFIDGLEVSEHSPCYVIAEISANHNQKFETAVEIIKRAKDAGVNAVKLQTYKPDTITIDCDKADFQITQGTIWDGATLYKLYEQAYTPWEWQPRLMEAARNEGITLFSSPFDLTSVDLLEKMDVPAYKIASFEINDIPLLKKVSGTKKPVIISTGIARMAEIEEALTTCREEGNENVVLLKCTSAYPTPFSGINLKTLPNLSEAFGCLAGVSDHTLTYSVALGAVALGAKVVEKHITIDRSLGGIDSSFSMEPHEFKEMIKLIRELEAALGVVTYELTDKQLKSREHSRSLYAVADIRQGEAITDENMRSIRPAFGLHTRYHDDVIGKKAKGFIEKGTPMNWDLFE